MSPFYWPLPAGNFALMKIRAGQLFADLTAAHAVALDVGAADAEGGGKWVMLLPLGRFSGRDGRGPYDGGTVAQMQAFVDATKKRAGNTDLVIDYDHQSVFSAVPKVGGTAPAAGWIKDFEVRNDGLWGRVEWTHRAARAIRAGEYRYISPVYNHKKSGELTVLICAGLTNTPNLDLAAVAASTSFNEQDLPNMDRIALALGLAAGTGEDGILTAINAVMTSVSAIAVAAGMAGTAKIGELEPAIAAMRADIDKVATAAGLQAGAKADAIVTAVQSAKADPAQFVPAAQVIALQTEVNNLKGRIDGDAAETAVNSAISEGRLVPALKDWAIAYHKANPTGFAEMVGKSPVLTAAQRATTGAPNTSGDPDLSDEDTAVMSQMGLSKEAFLKSKKGGE